MSWLGDFHFIRPLWLLALLPWLALALRTRRGGGEDIRWTRVMDPALLRALTPAAGDLKPGRLDRITAWAAMLGGLVGIIALAGPSWRYQPTPVFQTSQARVIVMDLSQSMNAQDLAPDRLTRARFAALDLIDALPDGRIGVVAFAGTGHSVVPLTADHRTVRHLVSTLSPELMPVPGSSIAAGLRQAEALLRQGDAPGGDVVLLTDSEPDAAARDVARQLADQGHSLTIIGFGTADGAPIPSERGGWVHGRDGKMTLARLDEPGLRRLASVGGGRYLKMSGAALTPAQLGLSDAPGHRTDEDFGRETRQWEDTGPWLVLALIPLMLLSFRRGAPWLACLVLLVAPLPRADAFELNALWKNADQRGQVQLEAGEAKRAAETFDDPRWKGVAAYRAGDYATAIESFSDPATADDAYNLGNALARSGDLEAASQAYAEALAMNPDHEDAAFNKSLVDALKQQQDQQQQQNGESGEDGQQGDESGQQQDGEQGADSDQQPSSESGANSDSTGQSGDP
uniref:VWA domain-containing protein n=1 Tax=uncultured Abyssibacter sp. TaxID=2320202 RepID=UPI0032B0FD3E